MDRRKMMAVAMNLSSLLVCSTGFMMDRVLINALDGLLNRRALVVEGGNCTCPLKRSLCNPSNPVDAVPEINGNNE